jgi:hypothetical protein
MKIEGKERILDESVLSNLDSTREAIEAEVIKVVKMNPNIPDISIYIGNWLRRQASLKQIPK